ncbi:hypothetical protein VNO77_02092 [Canavalia gladiata]|uniref:Uncharacterized protein n=1 Tax=Canavalia gladiata TaxID=3824 RepID=A0AAN9MUD2_CANGL
MLTHFGCMRSLMCHTAWPDVGLTLFYMHSQQTVWPFLLLKINVVQPLDVYDILLTWDAENYVHGFVEGSFHLQLISFGQSTQTVLQDIHSITFFLGHSRETRSRLARTCETDGGIMGAQVDHGEYLSSLFQKIWFDDPKFCDSSNFCQIIQPMQRELSGKDGRRPLSILEYPGKSCYAQPPRYVAHDYNLMFMHGCIKLDIVSSRSICDAHVSLLLFWHFAISLISAGMIYLQQLLRTWASFWCKAAVFLNVDRDEPFRLTLCRHPEADPRLFLPRLKKHSRDHSKASKRIP